MITRDIEDRKYSDNERCIENGIEREERTRGRMIEVKSERVEILEEYYY